MSNVHWRVFAAVLLWGLGDGLWLFILPLYIAQLGAEPAQIGWVLSLAVLGVAPGFIPAGTWIDRHPRKPVVVAGYGLAAVAVLVMAIVPSWQWFLPVLALYKLTKLSRPALHSYITRYCTQPDHPGRCFGRTFSGYPLGTLLTPALGGYLGQVWNLRLVFVLAGAFYLASIFILNRLPRDEVKLIEPGHVHRPSAGDSLSMMLFLFALFLALHIGQPLAANYLFLVRGLPLNWIGVMGSATALGMVVLNWLFGLLPEEQPWALFASLLAVFVALVLLLTTPNFDAPATLTVVTRHVAGASKLVLLLVGCFLLAGANAGAVISSGLLRKQMSSLHLGAVFGQRDTALYLAMAAASWLAGQLFQHDPSLPLQVALLVLAVMAVIVFALCQQPALQRHLAAGKYPMAGGRPSPAGLSQLALLFSSQHGETEGGKKTT